MRKKVISAILVLVILISSVNISTEQAKAAWLLPFAPEIASGLVTLGEIILMATGFVTVSYGVSQNIDQSDVDYIAAKLNVATDEAGAWWKNIKDTAFRVDDPTVSLNDDIASGKTISWDEYYQAKFNVGGGPTPDPKEPRKSKKIDCTYPVIEGIKEAVEDVRGVDDIKKSGTPANIVHNLVKYYIPKATFQVDISKYKYVIVTMTSTDYQGEIRYTLRLYMNNTEMPSVRDVNEQYKLCTVVDNNVFYEYTTSHPSEYFGGGSLGITWVNKSLGIDSLYSKILYSNYEIPTISGTYKNAYEQNNLPSSNYKNVDITKGFSITPGEDLRKKITTSTPIKNTDDIVKIISDADKDARSKGKKITDINIDGNTSVDPGNNFDLSGVIDAIKDFINNPLGSILSVLKDIKDFLKDILNKIYTAILSIPEIFNNFIQWIKDAWNDIRDLPENIGIKIKNVILELFVPKEFALENFKNQAQQIIEKQTGILSYPFALLIKLSQFVLNMDDRDCILVYPKLEFKGYLLCEEYTFNFTEFVHRDEYVKFYNAYIVVTDFAMIMFVIGMIGRKVDTAMKGG